MIKKVNKRKCDQVKVTFVLPEDHPFGDEISVVGDFNDWTPGRNRFIRRSNRTYSTNVTLPQNERFSFRYYSEEKGWVDEDEADDFEVSEYGSTNCIVQT